MIGSKFVFLAFLYIGIIMSANTQAWVQIGDDLGGEASWDHSGYSVSLSSDGSAIAIGAHHNNGNGLDAGHVRVFKYIGGEWEQIGGDIDGEGEDDESGHSVSINSDGSVVAIGSPYNDGSGDFSGQVRIFHYNTVDWEQLGSNIELNGWGDASGWSVSLSSDSLIVAIGAPNNNGNEISPGHVNIYKYNAGYWSKIGSSIAGEELGDRFGSSVSLSSDGSIVAIGAYANDGNGNEAGHVRVFQNIEGTWEQIGDDLDGEAPGDHFGHNVSINSDGSKMAISSHQNNGNGLHFGHIGVYYNFNDNWVQIWGDIVGEDADDGFGGSLCLSSDGSVVAIGAAQNNENGPSSGNVRIYLDNSGTWAQIGESINGDEESDYFGHSVSLNSDGSMVAIGAPYNDGSGTNSGHVKVFSLNYTNIDEPTFNGISFYPNPTHGILNIDFGNSNGQQIKISDINGKTLIDKAKVRRNEKIDLSDFSSGIYTVRIQIDNEVLVKKIVKN